MTRCIGKSEGAMWVQWTKKSAAWLNHAHLVVKRLLSKLQQYLKHTVRYTFMITPLAQTTSTTQL